MGEGVEEQSHRGREKGRTAWGGEARRCREMPSCKKVWFLFLTGHCVANQRTGVGGEGGVAPLPCSPP